MFTGIITAQGKIITHEKTTPQKITVQAENFFDSAKIGDSIAIDGVCLTIVEKKADTAVFEVADETLRLTTLGNIHVGSQVNLEKPMTIGDTLDGHIVQGHVDGMAKAVAVDDQGADLVITISLPEELNTHIVHKGSITINGTSLTVTKKEGNNVSVMLIPHTREVTNLGALQTGAAVNIEVDVISKYVASHLAHLTQS